MFEWSDEHLMIQDAVRRFIDEEVRPHVDELEYGDMPPYDILRKMFALFGMDAMARQRFEKQITREKAGERDDAGESTGRDEGRDEGGGRGDGAGLTLAR